MEYINRLKKGLTAPRRGFGSTEACTVLGIVGIVGLGITAAVYLGLGTLGWRMIGQHVDYEDKYHTALQIADTDKNGDLSAEEATAWVKDLGVTLMPEQRIVDVKPSYDSLCDYVERHESGL